MTKKQNPSGRSNGKTTQNTNRHPIQYDAKTGQLVATGDLAKGFVLIARAIGSTPETVMKKTIDSALANLFRDAAKA